MCKMSKAENNIDIFALTDSHQETRKLCRLFSDIIRKAPEGGKNTLICDCGDLFKGIYDRELSIESYEILRRQLPEAKIVLALGNNDFGFNLESFKFLQQAAKRFNQSNIHVLCANLLDLNTGRCPNWVDPYILLEINHKKVMVTAFCINQVRLNKYGVVLTDIPETFSAMAEVIKHIEPDALIVLNHALEPCSYDICKVAKNKNIRLDLLLGGHEHSPVEPNPEARVYYPQAFSKTMLHFQLGFLKNKTDLHFLEEINVKSTLIDPVFEPHLQAFEEKSGLNIPVAKSILNLEKIYSEPCALGTFIADCMRTAAKTDMAMMSTGYTSHALRYEKDKILTNYNLERAFSADVPLQTVQLTPEELKEVWNNAVKYRYQQPTGNTRFLQCSQNVEIWVRRTVENNEGEVVQILLNNEPLLNEKGKSVYADKTISCALDPFIGSGEQGFDVLRPLPKETLLKNNKLVKIKDLFNRAIKEAETKYSEGSSYTSFKLVDID